MIRATRTDDTQFLLSLADETAVFKPHEIETLEEVLADYHAHNVDIGHIAITSEHNGKISGFAYYAPAEMTDRTWYLWWIAVRKDSQARGIGSELLRHLEQDIREQDGRILFVETSSQPHYEPTRRFYLKHRYDQEATLRDFYAEGDSMVVFRKQLR